jgi:hypothetical protein
VDVRQMSLFGAAWTLASLKYLSVGQTDTATFYSTAGWHGVMETAIGQAAGSLFRSIPGSVFPLYHVFLDLAAFAEGNMVELHSSQSLRVDGLCMAKGEHVRLLLANWTDQPQMVRVTGLTGEWGVRVLDEHRAVEAMVSPEAFEATVHERCVCNPDGLTLSLPRFGLVRLDGKIGPRQEAVGHESFHR